MTGIEKIRLGISRCLLGENVRYDGGHALDPFLRDTLGKYVEYVPVCPEAECGFGIPREAMRLEGDQKRPRLVTRRTGVDHTDRMEAWAHRRAAELENEHLCGFIFKSGSPSSGMERVKVYDDKGVAKKVGVGIFARIFIDRFPLLPVEEDGRLHDPGLRENFIERIFTWRSYNEEVGGGKRLRALVEFHTKNKLLLMAHSPKLLRQMGALVGRAKGAPKGDFFSQYERLLAETMAAKPSAAKHTNVLQHIMGYFKKEISADEKQELLDVINRYRRGLTPLIVPVTLLNHYVRKYREPYLSGQTYLNPHPLELKLRNHV